MIKDIKYNGYTETPSDYDCSDGQLATSFNLICEDGSLVPIAKPKKIFSIPTGYKVLYIHSANNICNYILRKDDSLFWIPQDKPDDITPLFSSVPTDADITIEAMGFVIYIAFYDNADVADAKYCFWNNDNYTVMASNPPFINIEFDLYRHIESFYYSHSIAVNDDETASAQAWADPDRYRDYKDCVFIKDVSNAVWADINKVASEKTKSNFFFQPFFVRYAFRLFDGSYLKTSAPVLLIPDSDTPLVEAEVSYKDKYLTIRVAPAIKYGQLRFRVLMPDCDKLKDWTSFISHIDVFCSPPIYTYKQEEIFDFRKGISSDYNLSHFFGAEEKYYEDNNKYYWQIPSRGDELSQSICENSLFFKIASFEINEFIDKYSSDDSSNENFNILPIPENTLELLLSQKTLDAENNLSHSDIVASVAYNYNNRLHIANTFRKLFKGFPLRSMIQYRNISSSDNFCKAQLPTIVIRTKKNNQNVDILFSPDTQHLENPDLSPFVIDAPNDLFPRYLYYPDPDAYEMIFVFNRRKSDTEVWRSYTIPLTKHVALDGAFYFRGFGDDMPQFTEFDNEIPPLIPAINECVCIKEPNKIYTSEIALPFLFPIKNSIGSGNIFALSSANVALSQGQFGQFPIYAFSQHGIWALDIDDEGVIKSKHIISRETCRNNFSLVQLDNAVAFASDNDVNIIAGSKITPISEQINSYFPFDITIMPGVDKLINFFNKAIPDAEYISLEDIKLKPFAEFLNGCRFLFDYTHRRIFVYNNSMIYAFVYSLKSGQWAMTFSNLTISLNSFPNALACDKDNNIVDFSSVDFSSVNNGFWITRPLKLDNPDVFKTIDYIIQRGVFVNNKIAQVLYASNDLLNWIPVWSSKDKYLNGFSGTPYKYFRILAFAELADNHSVSGCSIKFNPKLLNKPR